MGTFMDGQCASNSKRFPATWEVADVRLLKKGALSRPTLQRNREGERTFLGMPSDVLLQSSCLRKILVTYFALERSVTCVGLRRLQVQ